MLLTLSIDLCGSTKISVIQYTYVGRTPHTQMHDRLLWLLSVANLKVRGILMHLFQAHTAVPGAQSSCCTARSDEGCADERAA